MTSHGRYTPAGAPLHIRGGRRWVHVDVDRFACLPDASAEQVAAVRRLTNEYAEKCHAAGRRFADLCGGGNCLRVWHIDAPALERDEVVRRLFAIEAGETTP